jgi:NADH-quinone oxidoreductase subunit K
MNDPGSIQIGGAGAIPASWFLLVGAILFTTGTVGVLIRRNPIVILVCVELMLNAVNLTLVTFSRQLNNLEGQLFALLTMVVAAAEAVVGLAILVDIFHVRALDDVDDLDELKG